MRIIKKSRTLNSSVEATRGETKASSRSECNGGSAGFVAAAPVRAEMLGGGIGEY